MTHRLIKGGELVLYGPVGMIDWWSDEGFSATEVLEALAELEGDITVRINSGGGFAYDGIAIYNALAQRDDNVKIYIDGVAASAASVIAMAGDEIIMPEGSMMMVHNASGGVFGTADDMEKQASVTRKLDGELARVYAKNTGKTKAQVQKVMDAETWMTGEEAVKEGFATSSTADEAEEATAFDYRHYQHAPQQLVALANAKGWRPLAACLKDALASAGRNPRGGSAQPIVPEDSMTNPTEKPAADAAATAAAQQTAIDAAAKKATEEATAAEKKRASDITAACALAGVPTAKAAEYIASAKTASEVLAELQAEKVKADAAGEINGRPKNGTGANAYDPAKQKSASASWDKHVEAQNKRIPQGRVA